MPPSIATTTTTHFTPPMPAEPTEFEVSEIIELYSAHRLLDGKSRVVKAEKEGIIQEPYEFDPKKKLRYAIAKNLRALKALVDDYNDSLLKTFGDNLPGVKVEGLTNDQINTNSTYLAAYNAAQKSLQAETESVALFKLDYDGLRVEENGIPSTVISALAPVLTEPAAESK